MKKAFVIGSLLVVLTLSLGGSVASKSADGSATYEQLKLFTEVLSIVQNQYVDEVPPKDLIYSAIKGTLRGLDPHSVPTARGDEVLRRDLVHVLVLDDGDDLGEQPELLVGGAGIGPLAGHRSPDRERDQE